jgi:SAM-dependent methyltransferase
MNSPEQRDYDAFARFYDIFYEQRDDDLAMYRDLARGAGGPILELGCGTGRVLVPLALEGHQVTGLDFSTAMLTIAQEKVNAAQVSEQVELIQGDIRDFDLASGFAMTIVPINTFMHCYNIDQQLACLGCIRRHLQPGGRLIIDVYHPDMESLLEADGRLVSEGTVLDPSSGHTIHHVYTRLLDIANQTQDITFIVEETDSEGRVRRTFFPFRMRFLYRYEMELLLRLAGYNLEAVYGSYALEPFEGMSEKMIFVSQTE